MSPLESKTVFIDTCIFRNSNFCLDNSVFSEFKRLCRAGQFELVTTAITRQEIACRLQDQASEAYAGLSRFKDKTRLLNRMHKRFGKSYHTISIQGLFRELDNAVKRFFKDCKAKTLQLPSKATQNVLRKYFAQEKPFQEGKKKSEFPDAFVIESLAALRTKVYVISADGDFEGASANIIKLKDLGELLHLYNSRASETAEYIRSLILKTHHDKVFNEIEAKLQRVVIRVKDAESIVGCSTRLLEIVDAWIVSVDRTRAKLSLDIRFEITGDVIYSSHQGDSYYGVGLEHKETATIQMEVGFDLNDERHFHIFEIGLDEIDELEV